MEFYSTIQYQHANNVRTNLLLQVEKEVSDKINSSFKVNSLTLKDFRKEMEQHLYVEFEESITSSSTSLSRKERGSIKHFRTVCGLKRKNETILEYQDDIHEMNNLNDTVIKINFRKELEEKILNVNSKCDKKNCYKSFLTLKNLAFSLKKPSDFLRNHYKNRLWKTSINRDAQSIISLTNLNLPKEADLCTKKDDSNCVIEGEKAGRFSNKNKSKTRNELPFIKLIPCSYKEKKKNTSFGINLYKCNGS